MNYSFDELVRKQCVYCLQFNPVDETCKVSGTKARNTCECNCFRPVRAKCGDCIHYANRDCPVGDGNTTADHTCECAFFYLSASAGEKHECGTCFWYSDKCNNKKSGCYGDYMDEGNYCDAWEYANRETNSQPASDNVNSPSHYISGSIECIDCIKAAIGENFIGFLIGNVIKYAYRYKDKNGVEDLRKSRWYIDRAIKELSENDER